MALQGEFPPVAIVCFGQLNFKLHEGEAAKADVVTDSSCQIKINAGKQREPEQMLG